MDIIYPPTIRFSCKENFTSEKKWAWKINKYLAVSHSDGGYKVFRMDIGLPLIETIFDDKVQCIEFAKWVAEKYEDIFEVWEAEPNWELLRVGQYTIPNGTEVYKIIEKVQSQARIPCQS